MWSVAANVLSSLQGVVGQQGRRRHVAVDGDEVGQVLDRLADVDSWERISGTASKTDGAYTLRAEEDVDRVANVKELA